MKCPCCGVWDVAIKDYREFGGCTSSYPSCMECVALDDDNFFRLYNATDPEEKQDILRELLDEVFWEKWGLV